jgi:hypothetical protein
MSLETYCQAMTAYFGLYGVTMTINPDKFWSTEGIMPLKFISPAGPANTLSGFFARFVGITFLTMVISKVNGMSDKCWARLANTFHVTSAWLCYVAATTVGTKRNPSPFVATTWWIQLATNVAFFAWGVHASGSVKKALKAD